MPRLLFSSILFLFFIPASFLEAHVRSTLPATTCDSLVAVKESTYGCTNFRLKNRNAAREEIDRFWLELVTPGFILSLIHI